MRYIKLYEDLGLDNKFTEIVGVLESECKDFLDEIGSGLLYRGSYLIKDDYELRNVRKDRRPMDMNGEVNDLLSDAFSDKFGVSIRKEGVFSTKSPEVADNYGRVCMFFPIGSYKYYYSNDKSIADLYGYISNRLWYTRMEGGVDLYDFYVRQTEFGEYCYEGYRLFTGNAAIALSRINSSYKDLVKDMSTESISNKMVLLPRMTLEEYESYIKSDAEKDIASIVNSYVSEDLGLVTVQEIVFVCDMYYLVDDKYHSRMVNYLKER